jgi:very-short-patch-repair endonuclease
MKSRIHWPKHIEFARELRRRQTPEEQIIWNCLRNRKFWGYKFLRQHAIVLHQLSGPSHFYIADFYCAEMKFVLEIDGPFHEAQPDYDSSRDLIMKELNLRILRVSNDDVTNRLDDVLQKLLSSMRAILP